MEASTSHEEEKQDRINTASSETPETQKTSTKSLDEPRGAETIRQIAKLLKMKPYECNMSLVELDSMQPLELLKLLNQVIVKLDSSQKDTNFRTETQEETTNRICQFFTKLGLSCESDSSLKLGLYCNNRETILKSLEFVLQTVEDSKELCRSSTFLSSWAIPEELLIDEDIRKEINIYKDIQEEWNIINGNLGILKSKDTPIDTLQEEITQLELRKEELQSKINVPHANNSNSVFKKLLDANKLLRIEQEVQNENEEKMFVQTSLMHTVKQDMQKAKEIFLEDSKKLSDPLNEVEMLDQLKEEVRKNRQEYYDFLIKEYEEKSNQASLRSNERTEQKESPSEEEVNQLEEEVEGLRKECRRLEEMSVETGKEEEQDKKLMGEIKASSQTKLNQDEEIFQLQKKKNALSDLWASKQHEYYIAKGVKFIGPDPLLKYSKELLVKEQECEHMKKLLAQINSKQKVLSKAENLLLERVEMTDELKKELEELKMAFTTPRMIENKRKALQEIEGKRQKKEEELKMLREQVNILDDEIKRMKAILAPKIRILRAARAKHEDKEGLYIKKKRKYDKAIEEMKKEKKLLEESCSKLRDDSKARETRYHSYNIQSTINNAINKAIQKETLFHEDPEARFSADFKTMTEMYSAKIEQEQEIIRILEEHLKCANEESEIQQIDTSEGHDQPACEEKKDEE
ncbi:unnamed protein product [Moneuplotes crassus]|uniref:IFT81 calponin homology domain-containing protein n=1 Tax=Euplotes crassus TaxID=5936 RepID=A0AAD2D0W2_EUPCR|nr:unnamed protein product [Moneuplotes crassus]